MELRAPARIALVMLGGAVGWLDSDRRQELLFLRNLGVHPLTVSAMWCSTLVALEILLHYLLQV
jgi:hypothetical protein